MISLCIATRGRPELLKETVRATAKNATRPDTRIVIALDKDDPTSTGAAAAELSEELGDGVIVSIVDREDSLGAKYNRAQRACRADVYVVGCDDTVISTPGWDDIFTQASKEFTDGAFLLYFGENISKASFLPGIAISHRLVELVGFFMQPHTPFWWHDTWADEIGHMIGRIGTVSVDMEAVGPISDTRGAREIAFWAEFFDVMRPRRVEAAKRIINALDEQPYRKRQLLGQLPKWCELFETRNSNLRDPDQAQQWERKVAFDAAPDDRYARLKQAAVTLMQSG